MDLPIVADGTISLSPAPGRYMVTLSGSPAVGTTVQLRDVETNKAITRNGSAIEITGGALPEPTEIPVAGPIAVVTANYAGSTNLRVALRRLPVAV